MSEFSLSQEIISPDVYDAVVQEIGKDGDDILAAVEASNVFCMQYTQYTAPVSNMLQLFSPRFLSHLFPAQYDSYPDRFIKSENIKMETNIQPNEQQNEFTEDQKNFIWNNQQPYENYAETGPVMYTPQAPLVVPQIPATADYAGQLDFDILITQHTANRNSWIYSQLLNKVFINMANVLPVDVKRNASTSDLFLRATLIYSLPQFAQDIVERCSTHVDPRLIVNRDTDPMIIKHVLRCTNHGSVYMGNTERKEHLSVITQLPQPQAGVETVRVNYQFMCKNSCPSGMNRRAVDVIFTLENNVFQVLGRRKLSVRVCSCPKRDKEKEEKEYRDSLQSQHPIPHGRKRKISRGPKSFSNIENNLIAAPSVSVDTDQTVFEIPAFKIVGHANAVAVLSFARDRLLSDIHYNKFDEEKDPVVREYVQKINTIIKKLSPE